MWHLLRENPFGFNKAKAKIIMFARSHTVHRDEERLIAFGKAFTEPQACLVGYFGADIVGYGNSPSGRSFLPNITFSSNGITFGWIENVEMDLENGIAYISHIATRLDLMGLGLGIKLVEAISYLLQNSYNIKEIHFCETSKKREIYHRFFTVKLKAKHVCTGHHEKWVWSIPEDLTKRLDSLTQIVQGSRRRICQHDI